MSQKNKEVNLKLIDWYKKIPKKYILKSHNPHYDKHHIKVPFRLIIAGNSGSGKTQTLLNLLHVMPSTFSKVFIVTKNKSEPLYQYLEDKYKDDGLSVKEGIHELPDLDTLNKEENTLVVLDDMCNESIKLQRPVCDFAIRCRKLNCSLIYISQSYYQVPKLIRDNINYLILKQVSSMKNLTMIVRECSLGIDKKQLKNIYDDATENKQSFLLIDLEGDKSHRFRKNFDEIYEIDDVF
jgi:ABC-type dipeptide/oligopeptide/nickel transport system ATPase component